MLNRYSKNSEINLAYSDQKYFEILLAVELTVLRTMEGSLVPTGISRHYDNVVVDLKRIEELELVSKHDIIAFCSSITEQVPDKIGKYFHYGLTSSDIVDTVTMIRIQQSILIIRKQLNKLIDLLDKKVTQYKNLVCIGRTHGKFAEAMIFGQKFLIFKQELIRRYRDYINFYEIDCSCKFSGAVGSYSIISPKMEQSVAHELKLNVEKITSQVIPRDKIAKILFYNSMTASAINKIALELRHLSRSEVLEVSEAFSKGQKGSSTMPHKKNPIKLENITGISRIVKSLSSNALENAELWHERDISNSSFERVVLPDSFGYLEYMIKSMYSILDNLYVDEEAINNNFLEAYKNHNCYSNMKLHQLIDKKDNTREKAYDEIQKASFEDKIIPPDMNLLRQHYIKSFEEVLTRGV